MPRKIIAAPGAPKAIGPYSQAIVVDGPAGRTLFTAGQIALDPVSGELVGGDVATQTERVLRNLSAVLAEAGMNWGDVVKTTVFLADMADFAKMNEVYATRFTGNFPARSTVAAAGLPRGARVEIELAAVKEG